MSEYPSLLNRAYDKLQQKERLPELFIHYEMIVETLPTEPTKEVSDLFVDIHQEIQNYKDQFAQIVQELGVMATRDPVKQDNLYSFFLSLLDLFKLAYTVYANDPEKLKPFEELLEKFVRFLETKSFPLDTPLQQGLLAELTKSAWSHTKTQMTMKTLAKQMGGRLKNHTRKQKRKA
jgi:hypothetical protein